MDRRGAISLADFVRSKEVFVLEVRGDSMQDEHILDGDYVLVEKAKTAHNGDIVVALVANPNTALVKGAGANAIGEDIAAIYKAVFKAVNDAGR